MMKFATSLAFLVLTSGIGGAIWSTATKNSEFDTVKANQLFDEIQQKEMDNRLFVQEKNSVVYSNLLLDMAINVCEIKAKQNGEPLAPCQQIRQSFKIVN